MDNFLKELFALCDKHKIYLTGSGLIDVDWLSAYKANSAKNVVNEECLDDDVFLRLTNSSYEVVKQKSKRG